MNEVWTVGRVVRWAADDFRARGIESPRLEADQRVETDCRHSYGKSSDQRDGPDDDYCRPICRLRREVNRKHEPGSHADERGGPIGHQPGCQKHRNQSEAFHYDIGCQDLQHQDGGEPGTAESGDHEFAPVRRQRTRQKNGSA